MGRDIGHQTEYKTKLTDSHTAVEQIRTNSIVGIGQAVCQPPALMQALAERAKAGKVDNVKVYYMHSEEHMKNSLFQYELMGRIKPYCMFMQATERALIKNESRTGIARSFTSCPIRSANPSAFLRSTCAPGLQLPIPV
jgi:itaconate CoA-transferase